MPELPEVETTKNGIKAQLEHQRISRCQIYHFGLRWPIDTSLPERIEGQRVGPLQRRAKHILMPLETGQLIWHLGMSGSLRLLPPDDTSPIRKHDHVIITLASGWQLRYHDPRRFGALLWQGPNDPPHVTLCQLGPEPLSDEFNAHYLQQQLQRRKQSIKTAIMSNPIVVGVGNIYACESLFMAGIDPQMPAQNLSDSERQRLVAAIKQVLAAAIAQGGTTLRDFVGGDGKPGYFAQQLFVYGRSGQPCRQCGHNVVQIKQSGRATFFCPRCQPQSPA